LNREGFPFSLGLCLNAVFPLAVSDHHALKDSLNMIASDGLFSAVEFYHEGPDGHLDQVARFCREHHLAVVFLAGFMLKRERLDIASPNEPARKEAVSACKKLLQQAYRLGAKKMLILSGGEGLKQGRQTVVQSTVRSIRELIAFGDQLYKHACPQITLEFFNPFGEPFLSVGTPDMVMEIASLIDSKLFGITFDTSHVAQMGLDINQAMQTLHTRVNHLHLANSVSKYSDHPLFGDRHPLFDIPQGDLTTQDIAAFLVSGQQRRLFDHIDICSAEVICREEGKEEACYEQLRQQIRTIYIIAAKSKRTQT